MPSIQKRPVSVAQVLRGNAAQITKLQTFPPNGITELVTSFGYFSPLGTFAGATWDWIATPTRLPETVTPSFTLLRPTPILLVTSMAFVTNGGTANYGNCQGIISTSTGAGATAANDINGKPMANMPGTCTNGTGYVNWSASKALICPPGTYYAMITYWLQGGATTTFTDTAYDAAVYQLSG